MVIEVVLGVFIAGQNVEGMTVDFDVTAKRHVSRRNEFKSFINVLVLSSLKELAFHDAGVLLRGLID